VWVAKHCLTGEQVALKRTPVDANGTCADGIPVIAMREIRSLSKLNHPNIIQLKEVVKSRGTDYLNVLIKHVLLSCTAKCLPCIGFCICCKAVDENVCWEF
jgi:hypothetical protein